MAKINDMFIVFLMIATIHCGRLSCAKSEIKREVPVLQSTQSVSQQKVKSFERTSTSVAVTVANNSKELGEKTDNLLYQVCAETDGTIIYCASGICCSNGAWCCPEDTFCFRSYSCCPNGYSKDSCCPEGYNACSNGKCCPEDTLCLKDSEGCCETEYPVECGEKICCREGSFCCKDLDSEQCCETESACCNSENCCSEEAPCCKREGEKEGECCDQENMVCCGDETTACATPCPSQFDAIPCEEDLIETEVDSMAGINIVCPTKSVTGFLYRATRPDENCIGGLISKNPAAKKTINSHVGCGSRPGYTSQFISFSTSLDIVRNKYWRKAPPGSRLVQVSLDTQVPAAGCKVYDLSLPMNRGRWLRGWRTNLYSTRDCEVLLACTARLRCTTIEGPKGMDEENVNNYEEL